MQRKQALIRLIRLFYITACIAVAMFLFWYAYIFYPELTGHLVLVPTGITGTETPEEIRQAIEQQQNGIALCDKLLFPMALGLFLLTWLIVLTINFFKKTDAPGVIIFCVSLVLFSAYGLVFSLGFILRMLPLWAGCAIGTTVVVASIPLAVTLSKRFIHELHGALPAPEHCQGNCRSNSPNTDADPL